MEPFIKLSLSYYKLFIFPIYNLIISIHNKFRKLAEYKLTHKEKQKIQEETKKEINNIIKQAKSQANDVTKFYKLKYGKPEQL